jgi:hypothetical protein
MQSGYIESQNPHPGYLQKKRKKGGNFQKSARPSGVVWSSLVGADDEFREEFVGEGVEVLAVELGVRAGLEV